MTTKEDGYLPNQTVRAKVATEGAIFIETDSIKKAKDNQLEELLKYYNDTLEYLAGKQVWDILDCMERINQETQLRRSKKEALREKEKLLQLKLEAQLRKESANKCLIISGE